MGVRPNPFRMGESAAFQIEMPEAGQARLRIFDVSGRLVRVLIDAPLAAGSRLEPWDGRDGRGRSVGPGVYFGRLEGDDFEATQRVTVIR